MSSWARCADVGRLGLGPLDHLTPDALGVGPGVLEDRVRLGSGVTDLRAVLRRLGFRFLAGA